MTIQLTGVTKSFGKPEVRVLKGVSITIDSGDLVAITGKSGSGKSTLLYIMSSLDLPTSGVVSLSGRELGRMSAAELHAFRNQKMGFVFQFHYLLPELTALENVLMPSRKRGEHESRRDAAIELLREFGLSDKTERLPGQLSGGEQQRVAIARALIMQPEYVFADEPTGNLDSVSAKTVFDLLKRINREKRTTIIYVTHDADFANEAHRRIHLADGQVVTDSG